MTGYKDILIDLPDSECEETVGFLNDTLADDTEAIRQRQDDMARQYDETEENSSVTIPQTTLTNERNLNYEHQPV